MWPFVTSFFRSASRFQGSPSGSRVGASFCAGPCGACRSGRPHCPSMDVWAVSTL